MEKKQNFINSALILIIAGALVKIIGALYKIPLTNLLGAEGMGIFSIAYNIYSIIFVLSTSALPVAISKVVSSNRNIYGYGENILSLCLKYFGAFALIISILLFIFAENIANIIGSPASSFAIMSISPAIFFVCIISIFRGYYQGLGNMYPTAISQFIEAILKLFLGFALAFFLINTSIEFAAAGAIFGVTFGSIIACLFMIFKKRPKKVKIKASIMPEILKTVIPITIGASVISITGIIDMFLIMSRLSVAGYGLSDANRLYGAYNMALNLVNLPQTIVVAICISIVPIISNYKANNDNRINSVIKSSTKLTLIFSVPASFGLFALAEPILKFLYFNKQNDAMLAVDVLTILAFSIIFISISSVSAAVLQSLGKAHIPVISMLFGCVFKIFLGYFLIAMPSINIRGAAISSVVCYAIISFINIAFLSKSLGLFREKVMIFLPSILSSITMTLAIFYIKIKFLHILESFLIIMLAFCVGIVVYFIMLAIIGGVSKEDLVLFSASSKTSRHKM